MRKRSEKEHLHKVTIKWPDGKAFIFVNLAVDKYDALLKLAIAFDGEFDIPAEVYAEFVNQTWIKNVKSNKIQCEIHGFKIEVERPRSDTVVIPL